MLTENDTRFEGRLCSEITLTTLVPDHADYERIRKVDNFIYFWVLTNSPSIDKFGELSAIYYREGDCKLFRDRDLEVRGFTKSMGKGIMKQYKPETTEFETPFPNTVNERILKVICNR